MKRDSESDLELRMNKRMVFVITSCQNAFVSFIGKVVIGDALAAFIDTGGVAKCVLTVVVPLTAIALHLWPCNRIFRVQQRTLSIQLIVTGYD